MKERMRLNCMNLEQARKIGLRPQVYRPELWPRALSILMRWASEPCVQREYNRRLGMCRKIHFAIGEWIERMEKERKKPWRPHKKRLTR